MRRRPNALFAPVSGIATSIVAGSVATGALLLPRVATAAAEDALQIIPDPLRLVVMLALFVVLVPLLNALLFRPLLAVLDAREERIAGARARATELAQQAAALLERHDAAVRAAREAAHAEHVRLVDEARRAHSATVGEARLAAERELHEARTALSRTAESVRTALGAEAEPLAREITARLLGRSAA